MCDALTKKSAKEFLFTFGTENQIENATENVCSQQTIQQHWQSHKISNVTKAIHLQNIMWKAQMESALVIVCSAITIDKISFSLAQTFSLPWPHNLYIPYKNLYLCVQWNSNDLLHSIIFTYQNIDFQTGIKMEMVLFTKYSFFFFWFLLDKLT